MKNVIIAGLVVIAVASIAGNVLLYQRYSTNRPLVRVGGDAITKKQYQDAVDYQTQGGVLKKMVYADLINQAAAKAGVTPKPSDIDRRIELIQRTKPETLIAADQDAAKMAEIRADLKTDLALDNLRAQGIKASDAQIADFYNKHKQAFALPTQIQTTLVIAENPVDAATAAELLRQKTPVDIIARQPRLHVAGRDGFNGNSFYSALPSGVGQEISNQVYSMKAGDVKTIPLAQYIKSTTNPLSHYSVIIQAVQNSGMTIPPLSQIKDQVAQLVKLQQKQAPTVGAEIVKLYKGGNVSFEMDKYADYFSDVQNAATQSTPDKKTASNM